VTHLTGRILAHQGLRPTPIDTKGFESLLGVVDTTCKVRSTRSTRMGCVYILVVHILAYIHSLYIYIYDMGGGQN
jgi:hypothetical protein